jgi:hypothetical protein
LSMEEILEIAGGHVIHCGPFNTVCEEAEMFQMWTEEYVSSLGGYLLDRTSKFEGETVVLDVGAGDGLLVHFLKEFVELETKRQSRRQKSSKPRQSSSPIRKIPGSSSKLPTLVATDDGSWGIFAKAEVEKLNVKDSVVKYAGRNDPKRQLIVLCSWMPMGADWTALFREHGVDEYILIGEADDGTCGHNWETWGNPDFYPDSAMQSSDSETDSDDPSDSKSVTGSVDILPSHAVDNYERWDMDNLSQYQFSRFDCAVSRSSKTVSFRKRHK